MDRKTHYTITYPSPTHAARAAAAFNSSGLLQTRVDGCRLHVAAPPVSIALTRLLLAVQRRASAIRNGMRSAPTGSTRSSTSISSDQASLPEQ